MGFTAIICNLISLLVIGYFVVSGWRKGALYMLVSLLRLFVAYFLARFLSDLIVNALYSVPYIHDQFTMIAQNQMDFLQNLPGISVLLTGATAQLTTEAITWWLMFGMAYLIVFTALMIFFSVVMKLSRALNNVVLIGWLNRLAGALEGLVFGTVIMLIAIYMVAYICGIFGNTELSTQLLNSWLPVWFLTIISSFYG